MFSLKIWTADKNYATRRKFLAKVFRQSRDRGSLPRYISRELYIGVFNSASSASLQAMRFFLRNAERRSVGARGHRHTNDNINYTALSHAR